jgi:hypothetical protein
MGQAEESQTVGKFRFAYFCLRFLWKGRVRPKPSRFLEFLPHSVSSLACRHPVGIGGLTGLRLLSCKLQESVAGGDTVSGVTGLECISSRSECNFVDLLRIFEEMELFGCKVWTMMGFVVVMKVSAAIMR